VDRAKPGSKHHLAVDANGTPLAATLTGANQHDVTQLLPLIDAIPPIRGKVGAPQFRPGEAYADRAYDSEPHRGELRNRGIKPFLAKRNTEHGSGLGIIRWVVEQSEALLHQFRRLKMRFDKRDDIHEAFLNLAEVVICWRRLGSVMGYF
jgi:transposase